MPDLTTPPPLAYAPRPPLLRRRWTTPALVAAAVLTAAAVSPHWWPPLSRHVRLLYWQHRCMTYSVVPGTRLALGMRRPDSLQYGVIAPEWEQFYALFSPPGGLEAATLFLHERTSPGGHKRLICMTAEPAQFLATMGIRVFSPATLLRNPTTNSGQLYEFKFSAYELDAGSPDPNDASHFTISGKRSDGAQLTFDCWLKDDDTVLVEPSASSP